MIDLLPGTSHSTYSNYSALLPTMQGINANVAFSVIMLFFTQVTFLLIVHMAVHVQSSIGAPLFYGLFYSVCCCIPFECVLCWRVQPVCPTERQAHSGEAKMPLTVTPSLNRETECELCQSHCGYCGRQCSATLMFILSVVGNLQTTL